MEEINKVKETTHALDNSIIKTTLYELLNGYKKTHYPNEHTCPSGVYSLPGGQTRTVKHYRTKNKTPRQ